MHLFSKFASKWGRCWICLSSHRNIYEHQHGKALPAAAGRDNLAPLRLYLKLRMGNGTVSPKRAISVTKSIAPTPSRRLGCPARPRGCTVLYCGPLCAEQHGAGQHRWLSLTVEDVGPDPNGAAVIIPVTCRKAASYSVLRCPGCSRPVYSRTNGNRESRQLPSEVRGAATRGQRSGTPGDCALPAKRCPCRAQGTAGPPSPLPAVGRRPRRAGSAPTGRPRGPRRCALTRLRPAGTPRVGAATPGSARGPAAGGAAPPRPAPPRRGSLMIRSL